MPSRLTQTAARSCRARAWRPQILCSRREPRLLWHTARLGPSSLHRHRWGSARNVDALAQPGAGGQGAQWYTAAGPNALRTGLSAAESQGGAAVPELGRTWQG